MQKKLYWNKYQIKNQILASIEYNLNTGKTVEERSFQNTNNIYIFINIENLYYRQDIYCRIIALYYTLNVVL